MTLRLRPTCELTASASSWQRQSSKTVFKDPFAIEFLDDRQDYGEDRYVIIGMAEAQVLLFVAYAEREERVRIISARRATRDEQEHYFKTNA